jgi:glycosyltransferase involved in cell wall biosynthesis
MRHYSSHIKPTNPFDVIALSFSICMSPDTLWFSPGYTPPLFALDRFVLTVHDLNHIDVPESGNGFKKIYYELILKRACRKARHVLTVSEFSRNRIIEWSGVDASRVANVGNGISDCFNVDVAPYCPGYRYLLCVSNRKPHKNEVRLLRSFAKAAVDQQVRLILTGLSTAELEAEVEALGLAERVIFAGRLCERNLASYYRGAIALVFPSLYEGFGLPVVEAMACGTPVITSNSTALPEIGGQAALYVDPTSELDIASAIEKVVKDEYVQNDLRRRGLERASLYSWDSVASRILGVLNAIA